MPNALANLARMTSATTGTGTLTLGAAVTGCLSFADSGITNGQVVTYCIEDYDVGGAITGREVGTGTYTASGTTLSRTTVYNSTAGGTTKINCSGRQHVFITVAKQDMDARAPQENGFVDRSESTLAFTDGTRTLTITPTGASFTYFHNSTRYVKEAQDSVAIADTEGMHYIYYDGATLTATTTFSISLITTFALVAAIYWDADNNVGVIVCDERHGNVMDSTTHAYNHLTYGARYATGLAIQGLDTSGNGSADSHVQFGVQSGSFWDEDIEHTITPGSPQALVEPAQIPLYYRSGAGLWRRIAATAYPLTTTGTGRAAYNLNNAGTWSLAEVDSTKFVLMHYFATGSISAPIIGIVGQAQHATLAAAQSAAKTELTTLVLDGIATLTPEFVPVGTAIFQTSNSYANAVKSRAQPTDTGASYIDWRSVRNFTASATSSNPISDGDKGDITVSGSGTVWEIDAGAVGATELATNAVTTDKIADSNVTLGKLANISGNTILGSTTGGAPSALSANTVISVINTGTSTIDFARIASGALSASTTSVQDGYFGDVYLRDDTNQSHYLRVTNANDLSANRTLSVNVNNADRTLEMSGNLTVSGAATVSGTNTGDQSQFSTIAVATQSNVVADQAGDTLTLVAGANIAITTDAGADSITIATTGLQASDATLTALASYNTNGILTQTASDTFAGRTVTGTANEITVTNGNGVSGNPTLSLPTALTFTGKTITGGTLSGITDIAVADGGTGASDATNARINLGLAIGTNVQAYDAGLNSIAGLTTAADKMIYTTASDAYAVTDLTAAGRALIDDASTAAQQGTLGLFDSVKSGSGLIDVEGATIDSSIDHIRTSAYYAPGDGGGALYKRYTGGGSPTTGVGTKYITSNSASVIWELDTKAWVSVRQFGAKGDNSANDTASFDGALLLLKNANGGTLHIPSGTYKLHTAIAIAQNTTSGWHNLVIQGDGPSTILDFSPCSAGVNGLQITGWGGRLSLHDFAVINSKSIGITVNHNVNMGDAEYISRFSLARLIVDNSTSHGIRMANCYMGSIRDVESRNNGGDGFHLHGNFTSLNVERCWAGGDASSPNGGNAGHGWWINGAIYSTFVNCSADWNGGKGWVIKNTCNTTLLNCASENNDEEGFYLQSGNDSDRSGAAIPDIYALSLKGLFGFQNSRAGVGLYANTLAALAQNSRAIVFDLKDCYNRNTLGTTVAMVLNGTGGDIQVIQENFATEGGTTSKSGSVRLKNVNLAGLSALVSLAADQTLTDGVDTKIAFVDFLTNSLGATFDTNAVKIPANVSRIKVAGNAWFASSSAGVRVLEVKKNGAAVNGGGYARAPGTGNTQLNITSAIIEVVEGDLISLWGLQTSGGNLNILDNTGTWMSVECIE